MTFSSSCHDGCVIVLIWLFICTSSWLLILKDPTSFIFSNYFILSCSGFGANANSLNKNRCLLWSLSADSHKGSSMGSKSRHTSGEGYKKISKALKIPQSNTESIIKKQKVHGTTHSLPSSVCQSKLDERKRRHLESGATRNQLAT